MSLFAELKRRNVFRVAAAYVVAGWLVVEAGSALVDIFGAPGWVLKMLVGILIVGFPVALLFSWAYELTPEGVKRDKDVVRENSTAPITAKRLDKITIGLIGFAVAFVLVDRLWLRAADPGSPSIVVEETMASAATGSEAAAPDKSIAVLPFTNMSADEDNEYFADGLSEEILNRLTHLPELLVTGRTSSFSFKGRDEDLRTIGEFLGVAHILEGSVRRQADQVRVTAQLVRAQDGFHLWSKTFEFQLNDVFAVQDDIAESVAEALDILLNEQTRRMMQNAGVRNVEAFVAYQRGVELFNRAHDFEGVQRTDRLAEANRYFGEAIENAPGFSNAHFLKSDYFAHVALMQETSLVQKQNAVESFRAGLEIAAQSAHDPKRRAMIEFNLAFFGEDWTRIRSILEDAARLPGCRSYNWVGQWGAFLPTLVEEIAAPLIDCEPLNRTVYLMSSRPMMYLGRADEALAVLDLGIGKVGRKPVTSIYRTKFLIALGRFDEARTEAQSIKNQSSRTDALETLVLAAEGKLDLAKERAELWFAKYPDQLRHESSESVALQIAAATGQRQIANEIASQLDGLPAGAMSLMSTVHSCFCGAPFDIDATPNFRARIREAGLSWPPPSPIIYPAKSW